MVSEIAASFSSDFVKCPFRIVLGGDGTGRGLDKVTKEGN